MSSLSPSEKSVFRVSTFPFWSSCHSFMLQCGCPLFLLNCIVGSLDQTLNSSLKLVNHGCEFVFRLLAYFGPSCFKTLEHMDPLLQSVRLWNRMWDSHSVFHCLVFHEKQFDIVGLAVHCRLVSHQCSAFHHQKTLHLYGIQRSASLFSSMRNVLFISPFSLINVGIASDSCVLVSSCLQSIDGMVL